MLLCNAPLFFTVDEQYFFNGSCFRFIGLSGDDDNHTLMSAGCGQEKEGWRQWKKKTCLVGWLVGWDEEEIDNHSCK